LNCPLVTFLPAAGESLRFYRTPSSSWGDSQPLTWQSYTNFGLICRAYCAAGSSFLLARMEEAGDESISQSRNVDRIARRRTNLDWSFSNEHSMCLREDVLGCTPYNNKTRGSSLRFDGNLWCEYASTVRDPLTFRSCDVWLTAQIW
jgi:hypothetical protein